MKHEPFTKVEAVRIIFYEGFRERRTKKGLRELRQACKAIGLTTAEMLEVESLLEYRNSDGELYTFFRNVR